VALLHNIPRFLMVVSLSGMLGCAAMKPAAPEEVVKQRAQARWDALVKSDIKTAYGFLSPGSRATTTPEAYAASLREGFWKSATVTKVECASADSCDAHAIIEYDFQGRRTKTPLRETWIREGSEWWYLRR
jgi:hypothetical protein